MTYLVVSEDGGGSSGQEEEGLGEHLGKKRKLSGAGGSS